MGPGDSWLVMFSSCTHRDPHLIPNTHLKKKSQIWRHALGITGMGGRDKQIRSVKAPASRVKVDAA